jgi:hypothetical protein
VTLLVSAVYIGVTIYNMIDDDGNIAMAKQKHPISSHTYMSGKEKFYDTKISRTVCVVGIIAVLYFNAS